MKQLQIIRERDRFAMTGLSRIQWWRLEKLGRVPRRIQISTNSVGWLREEVEEWLRSKAVARGQAQSTAGDAPTGKAAR